MVFLKYMWLLIVRLVRKVLNKWPIIISYIFLAFSVVTCLLILFMGCFYRVPVLSYYISEHELPMVYELSGKVRVLDESENLINNNVEVFVGGHSALLESTDFNLKFVSPMTDEVFIVIRYEVEGVVCEVTKCLVIEDGSHVITEEFIIYA